MFDSEQIHRIIINWEDFPRYRTTSVTVFGHPLLCRTRGFLYCAGHEQLIFVWQHNSEHPLAHAPKSADGAPPFHMPITKPGELKQA